jgi:formylglycine-generating enzyme required for sulfatase activity
VAVFETRVRDFEAFVQATHYDAEGGMSSAMKQDGFARRNLSWKSPGFPQTADDPVVGVCWEDAEQFRAWLTKKERSEERSPPFSAIACLPTVNGVKLLDFCTRKALHQENEADT